MRKPILLLLLFTFCSAGHSQIIRGTIQDQKKDSIINFASVYINGTSIGTHSDQNGIFELDISKFSSKPLTVSALGYISITLTDFPKNKPFVVYLTPKIFDLEEVVISSNPSAKAKERISNLGLFRKEFLGMSAIAQNCLITNEEDISFITSSDSDTLKAFSVKPIIIINKALGYNITYFLDKFELCKSNTFLHFTGKYIFMEDTTSDQSRIKSYDRKRKIAFKGSRMHFFRALWRNDLKSSGFLVKDWANEELNYDSIVTRSENIGNEAPYKFLKYPGGIYITYNPKLGKSRVKLEADSVLFDRYGYYDPFSLSFEGEMANQRIGDLLPFDYLMDTDEIVEKSVSDSSGIIEKVYLQTDRTYYYPGEDIWFKAYLIGTSGLLTNQSNNLHVELISPSSKIVSGIIVRLEDGLGNGDFKLSESLKSGKYTLRAYTNYMRNFNDQLFFSKEITVINSTDYQTEFSGQSDVVENIIGLRFFPEGGSMVDSVSSVVAFKALDANGKGCDISGNIYSSNGELITKFKSQHNGMGSFLLQPLPGLNYYSVFKGSDSVGIRTELPKSFSEGVTLSTAINFKNELVVTTKTNLQTLSLIKDHDLILSLSVRKEIIKTMSYRIKSLTTNFVIPTDDLPEGILLLTLSVSEDFPLSERLIYNQKDTPVSIQIGSDRQSYNKREPVSLKISFSGDSTIEREGNVSLAVVDNRLTESSSRYPRTIVSWFLLESDVRGYVEDPSYYFDPSNADRIKNMDLLLRTQGWRDFAWKYDTTHYLKETGFTFSGRLRKSFTNKPIEDSRVSIGIFGSKNIITETIPVDQNGKFRLPGIDLSGEARIIVSGIGKKGHFQGILVLDSVKYSPAKVSISPPQEFALTGLKLASLKNYYEFNESIRKKYKLSDTIGIGEVTIISEKPKDPQTLRIESSRALYRDPDEELIITPQMGAYKNPIDIMKGRIAGVVIYGRDPDYTIRIRKPNSTQGPVFLKSLDPLFLVDGVHTSLEALTTMQIYFIDRIDVLKSRAAIYGMDGTNGVINIITRAGDRTSEYLPVNYSVNIKINGYNTPRIFYSPQHLPDSDSTFEPDFRSTIYWEPNINLDSNNKVIVNYYNSDNSSIINVIAEGITTTGIPVTGKAEYEVR